MVPSELRERRLPREPVDRAAPPERVELLDPAGEEHLRRDGVRRGELLAWREEGLAFPANVGVGAQVGPGALRPAPLAPVDLR